MSQRSITTNVKFSEARWIEETKRKCVTELMDYCGQYSLVLDSDITIETEPSLFVEGDTRITARVWTK